MTSLFTRRDVLDGSAPDWEKSVGALIVINLVIALFDVLVAFAFVALGCLWMPSESHLVSRPKKRCRHTFTHNVCASLNIN